MSLLLVMLLVAVAVALLWPRPAFVIVITGGKARLARGKAPRSFVEECGRLAGERDIREGRISGTQRAGRVELVFRGSISEADRQRFRNVWSLHG